MSLLSGLPLVLAIACGGTDETRVLGAVEPTARFEEPPPPAPAVVRPAPAPTPVTAPVRAHVTGRLGAPYPIILAHGMFGTDKFANIVEYWWRIPEHLADLGELVYVAEVDPLNDSTARGAELAAFVDTVLRHTQREKVIIIGHSQGGLDARVVAHAHPDQVAAVVTISTPHRGSPVADVVLGLADNPFGELTFRALAELIGPVIYDMDDDFEVMSSIRQLSGAGMADFNARYPDAPGVRYLSIAGRTDMVPANDPHCAAPRAPAFIHRWDGEDDPVSPLTALLEDLLDGTALFSRPNRAPNDGLVTVDSARWGEFLGCVPADHLEEVGQLLGADPGCSLIPLRCNHFDHLELFADLAAWLRDQGL